MGTSEEIKESELDSFDQYQDCHGYVSVSCHAIKEWQREIFGCADIDMIFHRLVEEVEELGEAIDEHSHRKVVGEEIADVFIMLVALADAAGVSIEDSVYDKMTENVERTWTVRGGLGRHVTE